ncbi:MAG: prepilin-type N-terminal cleavage/methylation domain-containing protein [Deltaproteobacteria bacterium]|nr:prepilin-type N-terminal cleavage/methylation domain-containing protein [Deltaproteobacteria bacterium]
MLGHSPGRPEGRLLRTGNCFQGVTLVELMIVIVIMAVLASIALPGMGRWVFRSKLERQVDTIAALLDRVRLKAIKESITYRVVFTPEEMKFFAFCDVDGDAILDSGEEKKGPFYLDEGIKFGSLATSGPNNTAIDHDGISLVKNRINFSNMGSCNAGTIYLTSKDTSFALRVLPASGVVQVWRYRGSWEKCR